MPTFRPRVDADRKSVPSILSLPAAHPDAGAFLLEALEGGIRLVWADNQMRGYHTICAAVARTEWVRFRTRCSRKKDALGLTLPRRLDAPFKETRPVQTTELVIGYPSDRISAGPADLAALDRTVARFRDAGTPSHWLRVICIPEAAWGRPHVLLDGGKRAAVYFPVTPAAAHALRQRVSSLRLAAGRIQLSPGYLAHLDHAKDIHYLETASRSAIAGAGAAEKSGASRQAQLRPRKGRRPGRPANDGPAGAGAHHQGNHAA